MMKSWKLSIASAFAVGALVGVRSGTPPIEVSALPQEVASAGADACASVSPVALATQQPWLTPHPSTPHARAGDWYLTRLFIGQARAAPARYAATGQITPAHSDKPEPPATLAVNSLDTDWIVRQRKHDADIGDLFQSKSWFVPPPPPVAESAPARPQAPPLPFRYMGKMEESPERITYYLTHGDRLVIASVGDVIEGVYRLDGVQSGQMHMTYLPLDQRQSLPVGPAK